MAIATGNTYERSAITKWIKEHGTDPLDRDHTLTEAQLAPSLARREDIEKYIEDKWKGDGALARALAGRAPVLILDEPFAFLDRTARQRLTEALATGGRDRSLLVVDHRPETLDWVDRVVVLADGRITTAGPSDQLLQRRPRD